MYINIMLITYSSKYKLESSSNTKHSHTGTGMHQQPTRQDDSNNKILDKGMSP